MAIVRQHANVLEESSQAYNEMANGYSAMRSPRTFQMGQAQVAEGVGTTWRNPARKDRP